MNDNYCNITVDSVLRLRPLAKKESEDMIVLEEVRSSIRNAPATVVLNPIHAGSLSSPIAGSHRSRSVSDSSTVTTPTEYHFNHVLPDTTSQDKIYYTLGLPVATAAMTTLKEMSTSRRSNHGTKSHLLVCMGVTGSGKTYTCFGGNSVPKRRASQDGLVPRLVDSLFSQSKHHASSGHGSKGFAVNITMLQVSHNKGSDPHACAIHDLLGNPAASPATKKPAIKRNLGVRSMAAKFERVIPSPIRAPTKNGTEISELDVDNLNPVVESCGNVTQAREVLQKGLANSAKAAKGQNHHLLITMQPVFNGSQFGDQIAVLDMAGLEKGKKTHSRGKDSVANKNQAASAAVLHCLRALRHNTNVRMGTVEDSMSELSSVSSQFKQVPFRQHKVTMLLQPLFSSSVSTQVTLLLAAYPGHVDYYEKRVLLQDMEHLCGAALLASPRGGAMTGLVRSDSESYLSSRGSMDEDDSSMGRGASRGRIVGKANFKVKSIRLTGSIDESEEDANHPPAYAPSYKVPSTTARAQPYRTAEPIVNSIQAARVIRTNAPRNPEYASEASAVKKTVPRKSVDPIVERQRVSGKVSSSNVGGRNAVVPTSHYEHESEDRIAAKDRELETSADRPRRYVTETKYSRQPLGRSSLENGRSSFDGQIDASAGRYSNSEKHRSSSESQTDFRSVLKSAQERRKSSHGQAKRAEAKYPVVSSGTAGNKRRELDSMDGHRVNRATGEAESGPVSTYGAFQAQISSSSITKARSFDSTMSEEAERRIKELEEKLNRVETEKSEFEKRCAELEKQNGELKVAVKTAKTKSMSKSEWTAKEEEQFMKSREARIEYQTLVKRPLRSHMDNVNYIYDIKNQWAKTDKSHFGLEFPSNFQRAPDLDVRDREYDEREAQAVARGEAISPHPAEKKMRKKVPSPEAMTLAQKRGRKSRSSTSPLAALKKFALKTY